MFRKRLLLGAVVLVCLFTAIDWALHRAFAYWIDQKLRGRQARAQEIAIDGFPFRYTALRVRDLQFPKLGLKAKQIHCPLEMTSQLIAGYQGIKKPLRCIVVGLDLSLDAEDLHRLIAERRAESSSKRKTHRGYIPPLVIESSSGKLHYRDSAHELVIEATIDRLLLNQHHLTMLRLRDASVDAGEYLNFSAIAGQITTSAESESYDIDFQGSYRGATTPLWHLQGKYVGLNRIADLRLKIDRFALHRIANFLRDTPIIRLEKSTFTADARLHYRHGQWSSQGAVSIQMLHIFHPKLSSHVIDFPDIRLEYTLQEREGEILFDKLMLQLAEFALEFSAKIDLRDNARSLEARLRTPKQHPCRALVKSLPAALLPNVKEFELRGDLSTDLRLKIDSNKVGDLQFGGKLGLRHCRVEEAPEHFSSERLSVGFDYEVNPTPGTAISRKIGADNPDFVPYERVSSAMIAALLTTEDAAFFRHRGILLSQFRRALARNLEQGDFRLGASTITMQVIKNTLLSHDKTLSRKLEEIFLAWYLDENLSKERLFEIYLNAIEFGPGIYGIGPAARHYFAKYASEINALEAAFLASILPNPRGRYVHYCRGELSAGWSRYVKRILKWMYLKKHIDEKSWQDLSAKSLEFRGRPTNLDSKSCLERIESLSELWQHAHRDRLYEVVKNAAPSQLKHFGF